MFKPFHRHRPIKSFNLKKDKRIDDDVTGMTPLEKLQNVDKFKHVLGVREKLNVSYASFAPKSNVLGCVKDSKIKCSKCYFRTTSQENLKSHVEEVHSRENLLNCPVCDYAASDETVLNCHMEGHPDVKRFKCPLCEFLTTSKNNFEVHTIKCHLKRYYFCKVCDFGTFDSANFASHKIIHPPPSTPRTIYKNINFVKNQIKYDKNSNLNNPENHREPFNVDKVEHSTTYQNSSKDKFTVQSPNDSTRNDISLKRHSNEPLNYKMKKNRSNSLNLESFGDCLLDTNPKTVDEDSSVQSKSDTNDISQMGSINVKDLEINSKMLSSGNGGSNESMDINVNDEESSSMRLNLKPSIKHVLKETPENEILQKPLEKSSKIDGKSSQIQSESDAKLPEAHDILNSFKPLSEPVRDSSNCYKNVSHSSETLNSDGILLEFLKKSSNFDYVSPTSLKDQLNSGKSLLEYIQESLIPIENAPQTLMKSSCSDEALLGIEPSNLDDQVFHPPNFDEKLLEYKKSFRFDVDVPELVKKLPNSDKTFLEMENRRLCFKDEMQMSLELPKISDRAVLDCPNDSNFDDPSDVLMKELSNFNDEVPGTFKLDDAVSKNIDGFMVKKSIAINSDSSRALNFYEKSVDPSNAIKNADNFMLDEFHPENLDFSIVKTLSKANHLSVETEINSANPIKKSAGLDECFNIQDSLISKLVEEMDQPAHSSDNGVLQDMNFSNIFNPSDDSYSELSLNDNILSNMGIDFTDLTDKYEFDLVDKCSTNNDNLLDSFMDSFGQNESLLNFDHHEKLNAPNYTEYNCSLNLIDMVNYEENYLNKLTEDSFNKFQSSNSDANIVNQNVLKLNKDSQKDVKLLNSSQDGINTKMMQNQNYSNIFHLRNTENLIQSCQNSSGKNSFSFNTNKTYSRSDGCSNLNNLNSSDMILKKNNMYENDLINIDSNTDRSQFEILLKLNSSCSDHQQKLFNAELTNGRFLSVVSST